MSLKRQTTVAVAALLAIGARVLPVDAQLSSATSTAATSSASESLQSSSSSESTSSTTTQSSSPSSTSASSAAASATPLSEYATNANRSAVLVGALLSSPELLNVTAQAFVSAAELYNATVGQQQQQQMRQFNLTALIVPANEISVTNDGQALQIAPCGNNYAAAASASPTSSSSSTSSSETASATSSSAVASSTLPAAVFVNRGQCQQNVTLPSRAQANNASQVSAEDMVTYHVLAVDLQQNITQQLNASAGGQQQQQQQQGQGAYGRFVVPSLLRSDLLPRAGAQVMLITSDGTRYWASNGLFAPAEVLVQQQAVGQVQYAQNGTAVNASAAGAQQQQESQSGSQQQQQQQQLLLNGTAYNVQYAIVPPADLQTTLQLANRTQALNLLQQAPAVSNVAAGGASTSTSTSSTSSASATTSAAGGATQQQQQQPQQNLLQQLQTMQGITVFMPQEDLLQAQDQQNIAQQMAAYCVQSSDIVWYTPYLTGTGNSTQQQQQQSQQQSTNMTLQSLAGTPLQIEIVNATAQPPVIRVNGTDVVYGESDVLLYNGVMHVLSGVPSTQPNQQGGAGGASSSSSQTGSSTSSSTTTSGGLQATQPGIVQSATSTAAGFFTRGRNAQTS